ncbi:hypothetical protein HYN56_13355 [Flavobacterium crocinum]|uniref:DUF8201 domain-containing protein n=1 Tax=Flavobacterium crocinum TaxID=2183896 RepID=A0A2S1YMC1_9FLAO|nr:hypothetical protein [Flavobacterium crocinum]AWK05166.1 hypothetical protein HYN56_13355 [Flavobacterium crocinum]
MVLIIFSWIYILFTTINLGFLTNKILDLKNKNFIITSILGLFLATILASIWAIFGRINIEFHIFLLITNILLLLKFSQSITKIYRLFWLEFLQLQKTIKAILILITFLILAQCASIPFVIDNESYYIQTIKWLNEYGFVKGLANLHLFLGQTSGWHITQSVFNFSFLYPKFNDLSGFCLLLGNIFSLQKLDEYFKNNNKNYLFVGLIPLCNLFFFQFISAPSPDIPVYIFSFILFFYFLENLKNMTSEIFNLIVLLVLFILYIKNTTLTFAIIPITLLVFHFKSLSKELIKPATVTILTGILFIVKNMIICGSPIFPSKITVFTTDYAIPNIIESFYYEQVKSYGFFITAEQYNGMTVSQLFLHWLSMPKLNGLFNKISILLVIIVPFFIYKYQNKKALWILYFVMILQLILLGLTSPQYRFFMNFILFFSLFCFASIFSGKKTIQYFLILSIFPTCIALLFSVNLNRFSNHKFMLKISNFSIENSIFPYQNSKSNTAFESIQLGNLKYNSPVENDFFWANGDGNLPCVDKQQLDYFEKYYHIIPQMWTNNLKDGFYSKQLTKNE